MEKAVREHVPKKTLLCQEGPLLHYLADVERVILQLNVCQVTFHIKAFSYEQLISNENQQSCARDIPTSEAHLMRGRTRVERMRPLERFSLSYPLLTIRHITRCQQLKKAW